MLNYNYIAPNNYTATIGILTLRLGILKFDLRMNILLIYLNYM